MSDVEDLEVREVENGRREAAGEGVVLQVDGAEEQALRERSGDGAVEAVGVEAQLAELA